MADFGYLILQIMLAISLLDPPSLLPGDVCLAAHVGLSHTEKERAKWKFENAPLGGWEPSKGELLHCSRR